MYTHFIFWWLSVSVTGSVPDQYKPDTGSNLSTLCFFFHTTLFKMAEQSVLKEKYGQSYFDYTSPVGHRSAVHSLSRSRLGKDPDFTIWIHPDAWTMAGSAFQRAAGRLSQPFSAPVSAGGTEKRVCDYLLSKVWELSDQQSLIAQFSVLEVAGDRCSIRSMLYPPSWVYFFFSETWTSLLMC